MSKNQYPDTKWHRILASMLEEWLTPVGIHVQSEVPVGSDPPKMDILLLTHHNPSHGAEQFLRLADGLRHSQATHLVLEFKYTESLNEGGLAQLLGYDHFYQSSQKLSRSDVDVFFLSSKTPQTKTLKFLGYKKTEHLGVYKSDYAIVRRVTLLVLNELSNEPYNVTLKCFASRKAEIAKTYEIIGQNNMPVSTKLARLFMGLKALRLKGDHDMSSEIKELTPEYLIEKGKVFLENVWEQMPPEERLEGMSIQDRLQGIDLSELSSEEKEKLMAQLKAAMKNG